MMIAAWGTLSVCSKQRSLLTFTFGMWQPTDSVFQAATIVHFYVWSAVGTQPVCYTQQPFGSFTYSSLASPRQCDPLSANHSRSVLHAASIIPFHVLIFVCGTQTVCSKRRSSFAYVWSACGIQTVCSKQGSSLTFTYGALAAHS